MPNKFTQSILERQHQEALSAKRRRIPETREPAGKVSDTEQSQIPSEKAGPVREVAGALQDCPWEVCLRDHPKRAAKNKTFYLDVEVIGAVKAAAQEQGVPESKLVNELLRWVLLSRD